MKIPYEEAKKKFTYCRTTGHIYRNGEVAGTLDGHGYIMVRFERYCSSGAHRLAYLLETGRWPDGEIDHINGVRHDNRWENLQVVSSYEQKKNMKMRTDNPFGIVGVHYDARYRKPWYSVIHSNGVRHIERFEDFFSACCARRSAELKHGFHPNHGRL